MIPTPYKIFTSDDEFVIVEIHNPEINRYVTVYHNTFSGWVSPANDHLTRSEFKTAGSNWS